MLSEITIIRQKIPRHSLITEPRRVAEAMSSFRPPEYQHAERLLLDFSLVTSTTTTTTKLPAPTLILKTSTAFGYKKMASYSELQERFIFFSFLIM